MTHSRRGRLSAAQRTDLWSRWKAGQSLHEIGRAFGKSHVSIHFMLSQHGGMAPAARRRSPRTLTLAEREDISRGIAGGSSLHQIAKSLQRAVSTVSRRWPAVFLNRLSGVRLSPGPPAFTDYRAEKRTTLTSRGWPGAPPFGSAAKMGRVGRVRGFNWLTRRTYLRGS